MSDPSKVEVGDVVQLVPDGPYALGWGPLLAIVREVHAWGIHAVILVPPESRGTAVRTMPVRVDRRGYEYVGVASWGFP